MHPIAHRSLRATPPSLSRRQLLMAGTGGIAAGASGLVAGCGGDPSPPNPGLPLLPRPPVVPVDGPPWLGFAGNAQHTGLGAIASQQMRGFYWYAPVDMNPVYSSGALLTHYGSPLITRHNTVLMPVKIGGTQTFRVQGRVGATGDLLWQLTSDYVVPPARWIASFNPALTVDSLKMAMPLIGGRVQIRDDPDEKTGAITNVAFYGDGLYAANPAAFNGAVVINTPLVYDAAGNLFFGFQVLAVVAGGPSGGGIARIPADGSAPTFVSAAAVTGNAGLVKPQTNGAPALSADGSTLYVVFNTFLPLVGNPSGRLVALDATTLGLKGQVALTDPSTGAAAWISDDATSSPLVGPDGDVFIGVLESDAPGHNDRGWLLHFDANLTQSKTPGSFGWDNTPSVVPAAMVPQYTGVSSYLLLTKYNNYAGAGSGDGKNRMAVLDPGATQSDPIKPSVSVMKEVLTILGPTADPAGPPGAVKEWCVNTAAVDPFTQSVLVNSEDGVMYRWHLPTNAFSERITMNAGLAQSYTPTLVGPDGRIYAINNANLHSIGR